MNEYLYRNFKMRYPGVADRACGIFETSGLELLIKTIDGESYAYVDQDQMLRRLPKDSNNMTDEEIHREFGRRLYNSMRWRGISQCELSQRTGIPQSRISEYISGKHSPSFCVVDRLAKAIGCSVDEFRYI